MKRLFTLLPVMLLAVAAFTACIDGAAKVNDKVESGETLDKADYDLMLDYVIDAFNDAIDQIQGAETLERYEEIQKRLRHKYPYMDNFNIALMKARAGDITPESQAKYIDILNRAFAVDAQVKNRFY